MRLRIFALEYHFRTVDEFSRRDDIPKNTGDKTRSYFKEIRNYIILYSETFLRRELFLLLLELLSMKNLLFDL